MVVTSPRTSASTCVLKCLVCLVWFKHVGRHAVTHAAALRLLLPADTAAHEDINEDISGSGPNSGSSSSPVAQVSARLTIHAT